MRLTLGLGFSNPKAIPLSNQISPALVLSFTSALPSGFTYTGSNSAATYRNSLGKLVASSTNNPRFDYTLAGSALGILMEPAGTNKHINVNVNMTTTTDMTLTGTGATISVVNDATALAASGLDAICTNGNAYLLDNTAGSGTAYVEINASVGNTNVHSCSAYARASAVGGGNINLLGAASASLINSTSTYSWVTLENVTPSGTGRKMRVSALAGRQVWFVLNQLEESASATSPIIVNGAAATRAADRLTSTVSNLGAAFNQSEGAMVVMGDFTSSVARDSLPAIFSDGTTANTIGLRTYTDNYIRPLITVGGAQQSAVSVNKILNNRSFGEAILWNSSGYSTHAGAGRRVKETAVSLPSVSLTRLDIGTRYNGSQSLYGHIKQIALYTSKPSTNDIGPYMISSGGRGVITGGQSLADNLRRSQVELDNAGELSFISTLDSVWTGTVGKNWLVHGATGGAGALLSNTTGGAWWYDDATETFGDAWDTWEASAQSFIAAGNTIEGIIWDQGQQDSAALQNGTCTSADYKSAVAIIIARMRSIVGNVPVIIMPTVGRTDVAGTGYQILREAQWDLVTELSNAYRGPETFDLPKGTADPVHLSSAGYVASAARSARKILKVLGHSLTGSIDGPRVISAVRAGSTVTVTVAHDAGTDLTPTSAIAGFHYFDGANTEIAILSAVRTNATTITLTLASAVAGTLYYGYGTLFAEAGNYANLVRDNSAQLMPLQSAKLSVV